MKDQINVIFRDFRMLPDQAELRLLKVTCPEADAVLAEKCRTRLQEKYGDHPPKEAAERLTAELQTVTDRGCAPYFLLAAALASHCDAVGGLHSLRGCGGNSFLAFLLGISETTPLPPSGDTIAADADGTDGHGLDAAFFLGEGGDRLPYFAFDVPQEMHHAMLSFLAAQGELQDMTQAEIEAAQGELQDMTQAEIEAAHGFGIEILWSDALSALRKLETRTGIPARAIRCEEADLAAVAELPFLSEGSDVILQALRPTCFSDLVRALGFGHGTGTWTGNAEALIGTVCGLRDVIADRDDVLAGLLRYGVDRRTALSLALAAYKGRAARVLTPELTAQLMEKGVPDWYLGSLRKIAYLFPKAHSVEQARTLCRLAWYLRHRPQAFAAVVPQ